MLIIPGESRFKKPKKMLFAIDLKKSIKEKSLMPLLVIAKKYHTEVLLLQVKSEEEESLNEAVLGLRINSSLEGLAHSYHVIYENDIAGGIERFALENNADLLVMISKQQHLFERIFHKSIRKKMLLHSALPLLLLDNN